MNLDVSNLGQVFTPDFIVADMIKLIKNQGTILEPSAGDGAFALKLDKKRVTAIEYDEKFAKQNDFLNIDFFKFSITNKFDTIIGNPPYVRYQDIDADTKKLISNYSIFDKRSNLSLFFIYKSIQHLKENGELIFITPRDFLKATSAIKLNEFIFKNGTITDIVELGDKKIFKDAQPNTIIWRFEKNNFKRITSIQKNFILNKGQLLFTKNRYSINFSDLFYVKVGAVSGADKCFEHKNGVEFVCSYTNKTNKTKKMLYNSYHQDLEKVKDKLLNRKIRKFNDNNWYEWGRKYYQSDSLRIYVNSKTRNKKPFFIADIKAYDGSILAVFPQKNIKQDLLKKMCNRLNNVDWEELGFVVDGRFVFSQKSLENSLLPINFKEFL
jgi:adenine-specific DNA-methyltransferase